MTEYNKNVSKNTENKTVSLSECEDAARALIAETEKEEREHNITRLGDPSLEADQVEVYQQALTTMNECQVDYAVGAAFARHAYTNIWRPTKDLDVFVRPRDLKKVLDALKESGFGTEVLERHWLAKAWKGSYFIDVIFGTGHNQIIVDDQFLSGSQETEILGIPTRLIPVEELIAAAAYIKERKRFDIPDSVHLILATQGKIDWQRVLARLDGNRELLLIDLLIFNFIYPSHRDYLPHELMRRLFQEVQQDWNEDPGDPKAFRGTLLDPFSYLVDTQYWGYHDQREIKPLVNDQGEAL